MAYDSPAGPRAAGSKDEPTAAIIDSRTLRSAPESGSRAGHDDAKRKRGSKVHMAVDRLGHLPSLHVTTADVGDRGAVARLAADIRDATAKTVTLAYVDQGCTSDTAAEAAAARGSGLTRGQARLRPPAKALGCGKVRRLGHMNCAGFAGGYLV